MSVAIIDYGVGNLRSVEKAFLASGCEAIVTGDEQELSKAEKLVLPGVGAFAACMKALTEKNLVKFVRDKVASGVPLLGVCVGMQLLFESSDEFGRTEGLGLIAGRVRRFSGDLVVPQVGWNQIAQRRTHPLFKDVGNNSFCYFVHSYFCEPTDKDAIIGETDYGVAYASVVAHRNVCGVQFHPEKSQSVGLQLLANFARTSWDHAG